MMESSNDKRKLQDANLRDAIRQEEMNRPPMSPDLNARLMRRVEKESDGQRRLHLIWPWIAVAGVAAVIAVLLPPPRNMTDTSIPAGSTVMAQVNTDTVQPPVKNIETKKLDKPKSRKSTVRHTANLVAQVKMSSKEKPETKELAHDGDMTEVKENRPNVQPKILTECDIPITRPENLKYTEEEIALMKRQATEAYIKWAELELEIAKYNLEQTADNK